MDENIKLPHNIDAEEFIIGSILLENISFLKIKDFLNSDDFYNTSNKNIYQTIVELYERNIPVDLITLVEEMKRKDIFVSCGGASYLVDLINLVPTVANIKNHAKIVKDKSLKRKIIKKCYDNIQIAVDDKEYGRNIIDNIVGDLSNLSYINESEIVVKWLSDYENREKKRRKRLLSGDFNDNILTYISDEESKLDEVMKGGFRKGRFILLVADTKKGKSTFATHIQYVTMMQNKNVLHIFHEGTMDEITTKLDSRFLCIPFDKINDFEKTDEEEQFARRKFSLFKKRQKENVMMKYFAPGTCSVNNIKQLCKYLRDVEDWVPDIIIDDYPDYMISNNKYITSNKERIDSIYDEFIGLSHSIFDDEEVPVAVLVFSQVKAEFSGGNGKKLTRESAGASIAKPQKVSHLLGLYSTEEDDNSEIPILRLLIIASRFGESNEEIILYPDMEKNIITRKILN